MHEIADKNILNNFCKEFCSVVEKYCKYIIVSGYLAIASGRSRGTQVIDMILEKIPKEKFVLLHNELRTKGFHCVQDEDPKSLYDDYLIDNTSIRYIFQNRILP